MPWRAPTDSQLRHSRRQSDQRYNAERTARRGPDPRSTARWRRVRTMQLAQQPLCADIWGRHQREGRVVAATEVDHIRSIHEAPDLVFDEANLQSLCRPCHNLKTARERGGLAPVWLICGPPGAGKSTYVRQHRCDGDMVLDFDRLLEALSGRSREGLRTWEDHTQRLVRYVWAAYDAVVALLARRLASSQRGGEPTAPQPPTWILGTLADRKRRRELAEKTGAQCLVLAVPTEQCLAHIATDPQRQHDLERWRPLVEDWRQRYEPDAAHEEVSLEQQE